MVFIACAIYQWEFIENPYFNFSVVFFCELLVIKSNLINSGYNFYVKNYLLECIVIQVQTFLFAKIKYLM